MAIAFVLASMAALAQASPDDVRSQRLIRVERSLWRRLLGSPRALFEAFNWPARVALSWGEDVRIDRRIRDAILWKDNDDLPIPEPAADAAGDHVWWDFYWSSAVYPVSRVLDPGEALPAAARLVRLLSPAEAANVNALDEVPGGHLVHYLIDLNGTLGSWGVGWKPRWMGHAYLFDPLPAIAQGLHLWRPPWMDVPLAHPALGYFDGDHFDPERWKPIYPAPPFERATVLDCFWGARLMASLTDGDLRSVVATAGWTDSSAAEILYRMLRARQRKIAEAYFDFRHLNPVDRLELDGDALRFRDLAVTAGIVEPEAARYRLRLDGRESVSPRPRLPVEQASAGVTAELETSHDGGRTWSPPLRVALGSDGSRARVLGLERSTR